MASIGVVITTYQAEKHIRKCLTPWLQSSLHPRVLVIDSSSTDRTVPIAREMGAETLVIPKAEFNHGATREKARKHLQTDVVIMVTQDAYAEDAGVLEKLIEPLLSGTAAASYARQLPHKGADFFEAFARNFNYPEESHVRSIADVSKYGIYTVFCSDSCAAYLNAALNAIGGFQDVLTGEDTLAAACLLHNGGRIAYVAEARVQHSHRYTLKQEFQRHFDTGLARRGYRTMLAFAGADESRGRTYAKSLLKKTATERPLLLPYTCMHLFAKWLGYRLGTASENAPLWFKKACSGHKDYWK